MNPLTKILDNIFKIISAGTLLLLLSGFIALQSYYGYYNINISAYLSPSEILILSFDKILTILIYMIFHTVLWWFLFTYLFDYSKNFQWLDSNRVTPKQYSDESVYRLFKSKHIRIVFFSILSISVIYFILSFFLKESYFLFQIKKIIIINFLIFWSLYGFGLGIGKMVFDKYLTSNKTNIRVLILGLFFTFILFFVIWFTNKQEANYVRRFGNTIKVELVLNNNSIISSNDTLRFLGNTTSYYFFANRATLNPLIIPNSQIKEIRLFQK